jgi:uncharacterized membrane protein
VVGGEFCDVQRLVRWYVIGLSAIQRIFHDHPEPVAIKRAHQWGARCRHVVLCGWADDDTPALRQAIHDHWDTPRVGRGALLVAVQPYGQDKKPGDMVGFIVWSSLFSIPAILVLTLLTKGTEPFDHFYEKVTWGASFSILFQAYVTTILGYGVWNNLMKKYPAPMVAPLSLIVPTSGLLMSFIFFGETLSALQALALGFVFLGLGIFITSSKATPPPPASTH